MCSVSELPGVRLRGLGARGPLRRCLCWCCCCSCASCLAVRNGEDNGPTKKEAGPSDVLRCDGEPPPSLEEIQSWGKSFDKLMRSSAGRKVFRDFLRCEYSEENILFWLACEELKRESNADAVEEKARFIYEDYISILSPKEVSLDSRVREVVNRNMVEPTPHTFDEAQLQIYTLMHRDSYPRFVNSTLYKTLAQVAGGGAGGGGGGGNTGGGTTEEPAVSPSSPSATNTANNVVQEINPSTNETSQANSASTASLTTVSASGQALGALTTSGTKESAITTSGSNQCSLTTSTPANTQANNTLTSNTSVNSATLANSSNGVSPNAIPVNNTAGHKATNEEAQTNTRQENSAIEKKESAVEKKETVAENEESGKVISDT